MNWLHQEERKIAKKARGKWLDYTQCCEVCEFNVQSVLRLHHIIPVAKDGSTSKDNLVVLCPNCHALVHMMRSKNYQQTKPFARWFHRLHPSKQALFMAIVWGKTRKEARTSEFAALKEMAQANIKELIDHSRGKP